MADDEIEVGPLYRVKVEGTKPDGTGFELADTIEVDVVDAAALDQVFRGLAVGFGRALGAVPVEQWIEEESIDG